MNKFSIENIDLTVYPLSFPNSLLTVCQDFPNSVPEGEPCPIMICRTSHLGGWDHRYDQVAVCPTYEGKRVNFEKLATPAGIKLTTEHGVFEMAYEDNRCIRFATTGGLGVEFFIKFNKFEHFYDRGDGAAVINFCNSGEFLIQAHKGEQSYKTGFNTLECKTEDTYVYWAPVDGVCEGYMSMGERGAATYAPFERSIAQVFEDNMANFMAFYEKTYQLPYEAIKDPYMCAVYMIWSNLITDYDAIQGAAVYMAKSGVMRYAKGWHQAMQGMAAWRDLDLALELILKIPEWQDEYGMASGGLDPDGAHFTNPMAPIQGWTLNYVVTRHGGWDCISKEWAERLYTPFCKWMNWWRYFSDVNGDGLVGYTNSDSSGWNDATMFASGTPTTCPDIAAWLVVLAESCANLAKRLGKNDEADYWFDCSDRMLEDMIATLWNGEQFICINDHTGEIPENYCIALYQVVMLGKKLPQPIIDKMVATLKEPNKFLQPQGFVTEGIHSPYYDTIHNAMMTGRIFAMANLYMTVGLHQCGETEFALERAKIWAEQAIELGPQTIVPGPKQTWEPMPITEQVFDCLPSKPIPGSLSSWGCGVYLNICDMLIDGYRSC
ncbi:MAG: hypothetical protein IKM51_03020 [Oscillospiraceae bacterium]|nr:hypothetical protein [Oscillospiraceae bacterium]